MANYQGSNRERKKKFPAKTVVDEKSNTNLHSIVKSFNKYFTETDPNLASRIDSQINLFHEYLKGYQISQPENVVSVDELKDAFFSLKKIKTLVMTTLVSMLSKSVLEFYTNLKPVDQISNNFEKD